MFYVVSKLFWLVAQPISIVFLLVLTGLVLVLTGRRKAAIATLALVLITVGFVSYTSIGALLIQPLENRFGEPRVPSNVSAIVMLGGATTARPSTARKIVALNDAGERLTTTLWLAQQYPAARIVLSGGGALVADAAESEAETARRFFLAMGIEDSRLVLEGTSRNTIENARFTRELLAGAEGEIILVTSAFHMPRSMGLFRKVGIDVIPWPTDFRSTGQESLALDLANPTRNLETATTAIREWIGLVAYKVSGQIDDWLPAP